MIVVDADGIFAVIFNKAFQDILLIPVHAVASRNHKAIIKEGFHRYLNKVKKINSEDKGSLNQWLKGILLRLYAWNKGQVDRTDIYRSVVAIGRDLPFLIDLSPERSREGNPEVKKALDHFESSPPLLFRKR